MKDDCISVEELLKGIPEERPRHLFTCSEIEKLRTERIREVETLQRNVQQAYQDGLPEPPRFHQDPEALPYREYFGYFRDYCDRDLVALALGAYLLPEALERAEALKAARELFFHICNWNPEGPCSQLGGWGDEVGLSCSRVLPAVYDLLYGSMTPAQRQYGARTVAAYARQCEERIRTTDYIHNPGNSHVGRIPAYLGEAALVLWGLPETVSGVSETELICWLTTALEIYNGIFPYYGSSDGGWAEGPFYSTSYTKWYLPFFSAVTRFSGKSFFTKPFYKNYARFLLHFARPDHENHPFDDGYWCDPDSVEWPGFYAQNPFRFYGVLSGLQEAVQMSQALASPGIFKLHLLDVFLPDPEPALIPAEPVTEADAFPETGLVSLWQGPLHAIAKASPFGPGSHRHADQGSFALFYRGVSLITPSGYFGRQYGSNHHRYWCRTTKAHNAILVDGIGQDFDDPGHKGRILSCESLDDQCIAVLDLTPSYPMLTSWKRTLCLTEGTLTVTDEILADHKVRITAPLHMMDLPTKEEEKVFLERKGVRLEITAEGFETVTISDHYDVGLNDGEPEAYHVVMPQQYHVYYETGLSERHRISRVLKVSEIGS